MQEVKRIGYSIKSDNMYVLAELEEGTIQLVATLDISKLKDTSGSHLKEISIEVAEKLGYSEN